MIETIEDARLHEILTAVRNGGRLIYLPGNSQYRAADSQVTVSGLEVSWLLKQGLIRPVNGNGQPYTLSMGGLQKLMWLKSELIEARQTGPLGG